MSAHHLHKMDGDEADTLGEEEEALADSADTDGSTGSEPPEDSGDAASDTADLSEDHGTAEEATSSEPDDGLAETEVVDELPDGSEGWGLIEEDSLDGRPHTPEKNGDPAEHTRTSRGDGAGGETSGEGTRQIEPTKSDVLGFVKETPTGLEDGVVFLPGEEWQREPPERYVRLDLVQPDGRLTRPGACMLTYASKVMSEASAPQAGIVAQLNAEGVDGFARQALEIDPEEVEPDEDGFLEGFIS